MDIQVDVQRHDLPVILYLSSNAKPNWTVLGGSSDQMILVNANLGDPHKVEGVPRAQVWNYDEDPASTSALKKYFLSRVVTVISRSISAGSALQARTPSHRYHHKHHCAGLSHGGEVIASVGWRLLGPL
jgi:hypothetical protein